MCKYSFGSVLHVLPCLGSALDNVVLHMLATNMQLQELTDVEWALHIDMKIFFMHVLENLPSLHALTLLALTMAKSAPVTG